MKPFQHCTIFGVAKWLLVIILIVQTVLTILAGMAFFVVDELQSSATKDEKRADPSTNTLIEVRRELIFTLIAVTKSVIIASTLTALLNVGIGLFGKKCISCKLLHSTFYSCPERGRDRFVDIRCRRRRWNSRNALHYSPRQNVNCVDGGLVARDHSSVVHGVYAQN